MKNCIITGGYSGFGRFLSKAFSKKYNLYILGRSKVKFLQLKKEIKTKNKIHFFKNDLNDLDEIKKKISKIKSIDLIILNAGIAGSNNINRKYRAANTYVVNYLSNFLIMDTLIKKSNLTKVINITSITHHFTNLKRISFSSSEPTFLRYANSKLMMLLFMYSLNRKYKKKIKILNFDPGWMKTNFGSNQKNILRRILKTLSNIFAKNLETQERQALKLFDFCENYINRYEGKYFDINGIKNCSKITYNKSLQSELFYRSKEFLRNNQL